MSKLRERFLNHRRFTIIFGAILIVLTVVLTFILDDFVRDTIIRPTAYVVWLVSIVLKAIPAGWYYAVISLILVAIAINSFRAKPKTNSRYIDAHTPYNSRMGPVASWHKRLRKLGQGRYANEIFAEQLTQLLISLLATQNRMSQREVIAACDQDSLSIPEHIRTFILETVHHDHFGRSRTAWYDRLWLNLKNLITGQKQQTIQAQHHELDPILEYMESELRLRN